jgi:hypothetical protein
LVGRRFERGEGVFKGVMVVVSEVGVLVDVWTGEREVRDVR